MGLVRGLLFGVGSGSGMSPSGFGAPSTSLVWDILKVLYIYYLYGRTSKSSIYFPLCSFQDTVMTDEEIMSYCVM